MPRGKVSRQNHVDKYRSRKNVETMLEIRRKMYTDLLGVEVPACESDEELDLVFNRMREQVMEDLRNEIAAEAFATDPPLVTAIIQSEVAIYECEPIAICTNESAVANIRQHPSLVDYITQVNKHEVLVSYSQYVGSSSVMGSLDHQSHPPGKVGISGEVYRACNFKDCKCTAPCAMSDHNKDCDTASCGHDSLDRYYPSAKGVQFTKQTLTRRCVCYLKVRRKGIYTCNVIPGINLDVCNRPIGNCICYDKCTYSKDVLNSVSRIKLSRSSLDYELASTVRNLLPLEIVLYIEQFLTCREKFLLSLKDGIGREGCSLKGGHLVEGSGPTIPVRCICSTTAYRYPTMVIPFPIVGDLGSTRMNHRYKELKRLVP